MGLRRLLNRQATAEPLRESLPPLTELAGEPATPTRQSAQLSAKGETAPTSPISIDKTAEQSEQISVRTEKKSARQPSYVWISQKTDIRAGWADYIDRPF